MKYICGYSDRNMLYRLPHSFSRLALAFLGMLICGSAAFAGTSQTGADACRVAALRDYTFGINLRPSYVMPTHGFYNGWNPNNQVIRTAGTFDIQYGISNPDRGVYQGIGLAVHTFFADDLLGTPATVYLYQGAPLARLGQSLTLGYEWNLGLSSGWKNNGMVTVSPLNVFINVAAIFDWKINSYWDITFGPEYTHFSNGDTKFPNGGANTVNFRLGVKRHYLPSDETRLEKVFAADSDNSFSDRLVYDLVMLGGFRADRSLYDGKLYLINEAFPTFGVNFNPLISLNSYLYAGASLDFLYDRSANLILGKNSSGDISYAYPTFLSQTSAGLSARAELRMPIFAVNIGIGYGVQLGNHTRYNSRDLDALYGIFALKAFMTERLFLNVNYRLSSVLYSHNLMFGLGWRFGTI